MSVTGWKYPGTVTDAGGGNVAWTNPDNIKASDSNYATCAGIKNKTSNILIGTNYGFTSTDIPTGATINGIEAVLAKSANEQATDSSVYLQLSGGNVGDNNASATAYYLNYPTDNGDREDTYGGDTNTFGWSSPAQSDILSSTFGIALKVQGGTNPISVRSNYFKIRVYYTAGGGATSLLNSLLRKPFRHMLIR